MKDGVLDVNEIEEVCARLGKQITEDLEKEDKAPILIGIMRGALPFMHQLVKHINRYVVLDYLQISSYSGTQSTGCVQLVKDVSFDIAGRSVIIIEDVVDTGLSMNYLINHLKNKKPKEIKVCSLFDKVIARKIDVKVDYVGVTLHENAFLVGYGLDYRELLRNEPEVRILSKEEKEQIDNYLDKE